MDDMTVDGLQIEITASSDDAERKLSELCNTLDRLKNSTKNMGFKNVCKQFSELNTALNTVNDTSHKLHELTKGLGDLSRAGNFKLSSSIANQVTKLGTAAQSLNSADFGKLGELADALTPLTTMGKSNLSAALTPIRKLPETFQALNSVDMTAFRSKIDELTVSLKPLADEMQKVANGFSAFPTKIQKLLDSTNRVPKANNAVTKSYIGLAARIGTAYFAAKQVTNTIGSWIEKSNDYVENLNMFNVSMGEFATEAYNYAQTVGNLMGIDPGAWMRSQAMFMTIATGFGVMNDRAYTMSQNLTQLGYDLSSFFNITYDAAMQKLQSGISGELEPLRALGYDLSNARLEAIALSLGIDKAVSSMTQAEKAELRYYAIMTQVTQAQGDMARTLNDPANQIRVFRAQVEQAATALGNIFIPALNAVLPYAIAVAQVIRHVADAIANLFGFERKTVAGSNMGSIASGAEDISNAFDNATESTKQLKNAMLGIDELNVINPDIGAGANSAAGTGGFNFDLPTYDFIKALSESRVGEIVEDMKAWLGLTGEITSWADLFDTKIGKILLTVGAIGTGFGLWKFSKSFMSALETLTNLKKNSLALTLMGGTITLTGFTIEFTGIADAIKNGLNGMNFTEILLGGLAGVGGSALLGKGIGAWITKAFADSAVAAAIKDAGGATATALIGSAIGGIIAGVPMFVVGIYDAVTDKLDWLNAALIAVGSTTAGAGIGALIGSVGGPLGALIGALVGLFVDGVILITQNWDSLSTYFGSWFGDFESDWDDFWGRFGQGLRDNWNDIKTWWKGLSLPQLHFKTPHFTWSTRAATGTIKRVMDFLNIPARIPSLSVSWYKDGGHPSVGELFVARESGPEMVGKMGNRTTVANNQQIVEGISEGVYAAVLAAMRQSEGNGPVAVDVYLDGRRVTSSVEKRQHERGATIMRNGVYAY